MEVIRVISVYDKAKDNFIEEIEIDIPLDVLRKSLSVKHDDYNVFKVYPLNEFILKKFIEINPKLSRLNFDAFDLFYECFQR